MELLAIAPLLVVAVAIIAAVAASSHWWVRAESAARIGARAHAIGAPVTESTAGVAPPRATLHVEESRPADSREEGVRVVVPRGAAGSRLLGVPRLEGWSPSR